MASLLIIALILIIIFSMPSAKNHNESANQKENISHQSVDTNINSKIDSLLYTFGIDKSWIKTDYKNQVFDKTVLIPKDISTVEINLELSNLLHDAGCTTNVAEDIITKEITVNIYGSDSLVNKKYGKVNIRYSDKIFRNTSIVCLIIDDVEEYSEKEIETLLVDKYEFSYVFPGNLDYLDKINKLHTAKKNVIIEFSTGSETTYDADFTPDFSSRRIREVVKSFNHDFPWVSEVILFNSGNADNVFLNSIGQEFSRYNIKVITDSLITEKITEPDRKNISLNLIFDKINFLISQRKNFIAIVKIAPHNFIEFYNFILKQKKYGHKFYPFPIYIKKIKELESENIKKEQKNIIKESKGQNKQKKKVK